MSNDARGWDPMTPAIPDPTVEARILALLDSHVSHGGAGGGVWHADCLDVDCRWTAHGTGGLVDSMRAHQSHLAAVLARAAAPDALKVQVEALAAEWEQWSWHFRDVRKPVYKAHADRLRALLEETR